MASLRFPFPFAASRLPCSRKTSSIRRAAAAAGALVAVAAAIKALDWHGHSTVRQPRGVRGPPWASLSLSQDALTVEPTTGVEFPSETADGRRLLGVGFRRTNIFGLKSIDVYAFAVYADSNDMRQMGEKYGTSLSSELGENREMISYVLDHDIRMTVRLQIVYRRLSIRSVRSAFEKSVGNRLKKFGGSETKELLKSFVILFKDEFKLPKGSVIELSREQGYVFQAKVDENEIGTIQSKLLCQAILDLYIGDEPIDRDAQSSIQLKIANILKGEN